MNPILPNYSRITRLRRGYTLRVTPVPIPNTAVKTQRADDTALNMSGKVGRCDVKLIKPLENFPPSTRGFIFGKYIFESVDYFIYCMIIFNLTFWRNIMLSCKKCGSDQAVKSGIVAGKQRYCC